MIIKHGQTYYKLCLSAFHHYAYKDWRLQEKCDEIKLRERCLYSEFFRSVFTQI